MSSKDLKFNLNNDGSEFFKEELEESKYCKKCNAKNNKTAKFCCECGSKEFVDKLNNTNKKEKYCIECKSKVNIDARFCHNCGSKKFIDSLDELSDLKISEAVERFKKEYDSFDKKLNKSLIEIDDLKKSNNEYKNKISNSNIYWQEKIDSLKNKNSKALNKANSFNDNSSGYVKKIEKLKEQICKLENELNLLSNEKVTKPKEENNTIIQQESDFDFGNLITKYDDYYKDIIKKYSKSDAEKFFKNGQKFSGMATYSSNPLGDREIAKKEFEKAGALGHIDAQNLAGVFNHSEYYGGKPQTYERGVYWFMKAAKAGHMNAQSNLASTYFEGKGVPQNYNKALYWYKKAFSSGDTSASFEIAKFYENGFGVEKDIIEAIKWYEIAANDKALVSNDKEARKTLYRIYYEGTYVPKDYEKALYWAERLVKSYNDGEMLNIVGLFYYKGLGVEKDYEKAFNYFTKSANSHNSDGMYNLAECYRLGKGCNINVKEAKKYYKDSASRGNKKAKKVLKDLK